MGEGRNDIPVDFQRSSGGTGIYHVHSNYSYDGINSLQEIADWARRQGIHFVLLTEHDLGFDQKRFETYQRECSKYSGDVLLVPGMEYEVIHHNAIVHIGAIGLPVLLDRSILEQGILALVNAIHLQGGLAVLHHPNNIRHVLRQKHVDAFDFVELWNTKFDCDFGPNAQFLRWLKEKNCRGPYLVSADIHDVARFDKNNIARIQLNSDGRSLASQTYDSGAIIDKLRNDQYRCRKGNWEVSPGGTWQVPNSFYQWFPEICLIKKKVFRFGRFLVPERYQKAVYKFVNRACIR
jgi:hypothetical protein